MKYILILLIFTSCYREKSIIEKAEPETIVQWTTYTASITYGGWECDPVLRDRIEKWFNAPSFYDTCSLVLQSTNITHGHINFGQYVCATNSIRRESCKPPSCCYTTTGNYSLVYSFK